MATKQERSGPLLLLDGMSLAFRAYFALPDTLATSTGVVTNAVHGFTSMLVYLIREQRPSALAVAFDAPGATFRDEMIEDYKAGRAETPWLLPPQFDMIREVMAALAVPVIEAAGFEADDVIATLATEAAERQCEVVIVTGDRDSFQLVQDPYVRVLYNKRGVSDYTLYDEAGILERTGVPPSQYVLLAALRGDPSDNLPGVPGVGEKTAAKLLTKYGDLDGIFGHLDEQTPKLRENLAANEELARSNARIIPLVRDVPLDVDVDHLTLGGWDRATAEATFERYEMKTVWQRMEELLDAGALGERRPRAVRAAPPGRRGEAAAPAPTTTAPADRRSALRAARRGAAHDGGGDHEAADRARHRPRSRWPPAGTACPGAATWSRSSLVATEGEEAGLGVLVPGELLGGRRGGQEAQRRPGPSGRRATTSRRSCGRCCPLGIDLTGLEMDTAVAAYLLDASTGEYELAQLREQTGQLSLDIVEPGETARDMAQEAAAEAADVAAMATGFRRRLQSEDMVMLHDDIETPLVRVLAKMEVAGIGVDRAELQAIADSLKASAAMLQAEVQRLRRPRVQRQLDAAVAHGALRRARPDAGQEDQDRLLHRRPDAREPARGPSRSSRRCSPTARWRSCAPPTGRACWPRCRPTAASTPRSARRWRGPGASPRTAPTCTTSRCAPSRASSSGAPSCRPRAPPSWWPTTTRWSCAASRTSRRTRG